jgi:hypothetical protein
MPVRSGAGGSVVVDVCAAAEAEDVAWLLAVPGEAGEVVADCVGRDGFGVSEACEEPEAAFDEGEAVRPIGEHCPYVRPEEVDFAVRGLASGDEGAEPVGG